MLQDIVVTNQQSLLRASQCKFSSSDTIQLLIHILKKSITPPTVTS